MVEWKRLRLSVRFSPFRDLTPAMIYKLPSEAPKLAQMRQYFLKAVSPEKRKKNRREVRRGDDQLGLNCQKGKHYSSVSLRAAKSLSSKSVTSLTDSIGNLHLASCGQSLSLFYAPPPAVQRAKHPHRWLARLSGNLFARPFAPIVVQSS